MSLPKFIPTYTLKLCQQKQQNLHFYCLLWSLSKGRSGADHAVSSSDRGTLMNYLLNIKSSEWLYALLYNLRMCWNELEMTRKRKMTNIFLTICKTCAEAFDGRWQKTAKLTNMLRINDGAFGGCWVCDESRLMNDCRRSTLRGHGETEKRVRRWSHASLACTWKQQTNTYR